MPELSNLLRQRLGAEKTAETNTAGVHPDADTLAAYSEQLLPGVERQQVIKHLVACGECREVLALSQTELVEPATQPVLKPAPVSVWKKLFTPAFGLAGLVAAMALIAILVLQVPRNSSQQASKESSVVPPSDQKTAEAKPSTPPVVAVESQPAAQENDRLARPSSPSVAGLDALSRPARLPNRIASAKQAAPASSLPLTADMTKQDFVNKMFFETNSQDVVMGARDYPSAPQPAQSDARFNLASPGPIRSFSDIPANVTNGKSSVAILTPPPPPEHFGLRLDKLAIKGARSVFRAPMGAPAISSHSLASSAMLAAPKGEASAVAAAPAKSAGSGFAESPAFSPATRRSLSSAETSAATWKVADGKLLKAYGQSAWEEAQTPAAFEFTIVNAHGGEVWAGGANAGLIHSYDGGNTWNLVTLGEGASGRVVSILFAGNHVQVETSDDQSWSSSDGGKSWTQK
jgi:Photosynthesis system II assembly factor YCF48